MIMIDINTYILHINVNLINILIVSLLLGLIYTMLKLYINVPPSFTFCVPI